MPTLRHYTITLICLLIHYFGNAQVCNDSVQSYSLYSTYKLEHIGGSFQQLQNGHTANTAWVHTPSGRKLSIILTDKDGQFVTAKYIELTDASYTLGLTNIIEAPGNSLIAYGRLTTSTGHDKGVVIIKFDNNLALQWSTLIRRSITEPETAVYYTWGLHCDEQSNLYFSFYSMPGGPTIAPNIFFVSLDANGSLRWSKGIDYRALPTPVFAFNAITSIDNKALFIGNYEDNYHPGLIGLSLDQNTGSFIKMSSSVLNTTGNVTISQTHSQNIRLWPRSKDFYYAFGEETSMPIESNIIHLLIDTSFTITKTRRFKGNMWAHSWYQFNLSKNGLISLLGHENHLTTDHFAVVDSAGNVLISKKTGTNLFAWPSLYPAIISHDEQRLTVSVGNAPTLDSIKRISLPLNGDTTLYSCLGKDTSFFSIEDVSLTKTDINPGTIYSNVVQLSALGIQTSDLTAQKQEFCKVVSSCSSLQITGSSLFCTGTPQVFVARKNEACLKKINWQLDGIPATLMNQTDSSVTLQFHAVWNGSITASIQSCDIISSFQVDVREPLEPFSLGNEIIICPEDSVTLTAPEGYPQYQWSNGKTSSQIRVGTPATYTVMVTDDCGNTISSSVDVKHPIHVSPVVSSTIICKRDSVFITLPASLSSITWNSTVTSAGNNSFYTLPESTLAYIIQAQDEYDCPYSDGFTITVNPCLEKMWLPSAFSPNDDFLNDTFGAETDGRLRSFSLAVYNQWGQRVFYTTNPANKWDGKIKGTPAMVGVYVWMCRYQFLNGPAKINKGTVVLIR